MRIIKSEKFICLRLNQVVDTWFLGEPFWNETETALHSHCAPLVKVFGKKGIQFTVHSSQAWKRKDSLRFDIYALSWLLPFQIRSFCMQNNLWWTTKPIETLKYTLFSNAIQNWQIKQQLKRHKLRETCAELKILFSSKIDQLRPFFN